MQKLACFAFFIFFFWSSIDTYAQAPSVEWSRNDGGSLDDSFIDVKKTNDNGYIAVGQSFSNSNGLTNAGSGDVLLAKYDMSGSLLWKKTFGGSGEDLGDAIIITADGGYLIAGYKNLGGNNDNAWLIKTDDAGVIQWEKTYGGSDVDRAHGVVETASGDFIFAGTTSSTDGDVTGPLASLTDGWVAKVSKTNGALIWNKAIGDNGDYEVLRDIKKINATDYILAGATNSDNFAVLGSYGMIDAWAVKISDTGSGVNVIFSKAFGNADDDEAHAIEKVSNGFILTGYTKSGSFGGQDILLTKMNNSGFKVWSKNIGGVENDIAKSLLITADNKIILAGSTFSSSYANYHALEDLLVVQTDATGVVEWSKAYGGSKSDNGNSVVQANGTNLVAVGFSASTSGDLVNANPNVGKDDAFIVKLSPCGMLITPQISDVKCNGGNNGAITLTITNGASPYSYSWSNSGNSATISGLNAGNYSYTISDASGCVKSANITVKEPPLLTATVSVAGSTLTANASGGTPSYTYSWSCSPPQNTKVTTALPAGTYTVTVTDANGCTVTATGTIGSIPAPLSATTTHSNVKCFGGNDGTATANTNGGTAPFTYKWSTTPQQITQTATNLLAGNYTVTVTDANNNSTTAIVLIEQPTAALQVSTTTSNNSATAATTGGTTPYSYAWSTTPQQTTATATGLSANTYTVTVTDANGCTASATATITAASPLAVSFTKIDVKCNGATTGSISVTASGATSPYTYSWNTIPVQSTATASNLGAGTYSVVVTAANGASTTITATINQPTPLVVTVATTTNSATATVSGGKNPYYYAWNTTPVQSTATATGLAVGTYIVTVTDANGCTATASGTIDAPAPLTTTLSQTNIKCNGATTGTATVTANGATAPYTYLWSTSPAQTTPVATNLAAGTYTVTVTAANGVSTTATVTIIQPTPLIVNVTTTSNTATANPSGGTAPYTYAWNVPQTTKMITSLSAGTYSVTVTDDNGCTAVASGIVAISIPLTVTTTQINVKCNGTATGTATVTPNGGTSPYSYQWNTTPQQTTATANNLSAGTYTVTVTDAKNAIIKATVTITQPIPLVVNVTTTTNSATANPSGGTAPYTYTWNTTPQKIEQTITGLTAGTYTVTVSDSNNCTAVASATISTVPSPITISISVNNVKCYGSDDGSATVNPKGGTAPYTYLWDTTPANTTATISNKKAGDYSVIVTDKNNNTATVTINISEPPPLKVNVVLAGNSATANVTGGVAPYIYQWLNGSSTPTINNLSAGTQTVTITDSNGCKVTGDVTIAGGTLAVTITSTNILCNNETNGTATANPTGGTGPYTFLWSINASILQKVTNLDKGLYSVTVTDKTGATATSSIDIINPEKLKASIVQPTSTSATANATGGTAPYSYLWNKGVGLTTQTVTGLVPDNYVVTITDANGCTASAIKTIVPLPGFNAAISVTEIKCKGNKDGTATVTTSGGLAPLQYLWSNGKNTETINALEAGAYSVTVTDKNNVTASATTTLLEPTLLKITIATTSNTATATATGGIAPYVYVWSNAKNGAGIDNLTDGEYTVTVTDKNGCTASATTTIGVPTPSLELIIEIKNVNCPSGKDGSAKASVVGGTGPFTFEWSNSKKDALNDGLPAGNYSVTVTDAKKAKQVKSVTIKQPPAYTVEFTYVGTAATIHLSGGTPGYSYFWSNGQKDSTATNLPGGKTYTVTTTDKNQCTATFQVTIPPSTEFYVTLTSTNVSCYNGSDGTATVTTFNGKAPYTYLWSNNSTENPAKNLKAGTYTVTVTDADGKTTTATVLIEQPAIISITFANGTYARPTGGTGNFSYLWDNGEKTSNITAPPGTVHALTVTDANGCIVTDTLHIPKDTSDLRCRATIGIVPSDPENANLIIPQIEEFKKGQITPQPVTMTVIDRYGALLYSNEDYQNDWNGASLPPGTYYFLATTRNVVNKVCVGTVTVFREK
jgi:large repetitive protein